MLSNASNRWDAVRPGSEQARRMFAYIHLTHTGVRPPSALAMPLEEVPFMITLEPLYFAVLPPSVVPVLAFLAPILAFSLVVIVPRIKLELLRVADTAKRESEQYKEKGL